MMGRQKQLCFLGDSLIEFFDWQDRFPAAVVDNLGVAGETTGELLARSASLDEQLLPADAIILMIGTNDLLMGTDFFATYDALLSRLRQNFPVAFLLANGLMPMTLPWYTPELISQTNCRLAEIANRHGIAFLDNTRLAADATSLPPLFLDDGVHLSETGYALWSAAIAQQLTDQSCL